MNPVSVMKYVLLALVSCLFAPPPLSAERPLSDDETRWLQRVDEARQPPARDQDFDTYFRCLATQRDHLVEMIDQFVTRFPSSSRREPLLALKLETLFYLAVHRQLTLANLAAEADRILAASPGPDLAAHAAYWGFRARLAELERAGAPFDLVDARRVEWSRDFVERYPTSLLAPPIFVDLIQRAWERNDDKEAAEYQKLLETNFPDNVLTEHFRAALHRRNAVNRPADINLSTTDGRTVSSNRRNGRFLLVHFWAGFSPQSVANLRTLIHLYDKHHSTRLDVLGVNLDTDKAAFDTLVARYRNPWPQYHDGLGWASAPVRQWAVQTLPTTLLINPAGRLVLLSIDADPVPTIAVAVESSPATNQTTQPASSPEARAQATVLSTSESRPASSSAP